MRYIKCLQHEIIIFRKIHKLNNLCEFYESNLKFKVKKKKSKNCFLYMFLDFGNNISVNNIY